MLILTRRLGESIVIGDSVSVMILGVKGNQVRVGIDAPREVAVHREEIYERIKREKQGNDDSHGDGGSYGGGSRGERDSQSQSHDNESAEFASA